MTETMICSFCQNEVNAQAIACPHCGNHFNTEDDANKNEVFHPTQRVQVPYRLLMVAACGIMIAGSLMPWGLMESMLGSFPIRGSEGDGVLTAGIGVLLFLVALLPERSSKNRRLSFIAGSVISGVILIPKLFWFLPDPKLAGSGLTSQLYAGLILAVVGVILVLVSAIVTRSKDLRM